MIEYLCVTAVKHVAELNKGKNKYGEGEMEGIGRWRNDAKKK